MVWVRASEELAIFTAAEEGCYGVLPRADCVDADAEVGVGLSVVVTKEAGSIDKLNFFLVVA
jgi:hypothetical protein